MIFARSDFVNVYKRRQAFKLQTSPLWRPLVEDGAQSFAVKPETESIVHCKLSDLPLAIFVVNRPEALQVRFVNRVLFPSANLQFPLDSARKRLHIGLTNEF